MREIKFRVRMFDGTFVYLDIFEIVGWTPNKKIERFDRYTGLKDKNGIEVYEGNIISSDISHPLEVFWMGLAWGVRFKDLGNIEEGIICDDGGDMTINEGKLEYMKVIGNVYESPELLEEKK